MDTFTADAIFISASRERVFAALLDPREAQVWLGSGSVTLEPRLGGRFAVRLEDGAQVEGKIGRLDPGRRLDIVEYFWERDGVRRGPMTLSFRLAEEPGGLWITARQEDLDSGPDWKVFAQEAKKGLVRLTLALKRHIEDI